MILLFYLLHHYYFGCQYYKGTKQILIAACVVEFTGLQSNVLVCKLLFYTVKFTRFIFFINVFTFVLNFFLTKLFLQPQLPKLFSKKYIFYFYLKSAKLEQLVLFLMHFNCAKVELLQVYFKHILDKYKKMCIVHK